MRTPRGSLQAPSLLAIRFKSSVEAEESDSIRKQTRETKYMFRLQINCGAPSAPSPLPQPPEPCPFANRAELSSRRAVEIYRTLSALQDPGCLMTRGLRRI